MSLTLLPAFGTPFLLPGLSVTCYVNVLCQIDFPGGLLLFEGKPRSCGSGRKGRWMREKRRGEEGEEEAEEAMSTDPSIRPHGKSR